jgi:hypothetical protein
MFTKHLSERVPCIYSFIRLFHSFKNSSLCHFDAIREWDQCISSYLIVLNHAGTHLVFCYKQNNTLSKSSIPITLRYFNTLLAKSKSTLSNYIIHFNTSLNEISIDQFFIIFLTSSICVCSSTGYFIFINFYFA